MITVAVQQGSRTAEVSSFIGRDAEVGELQDLLQHARAVTLCGPGGIGKSRLALRLLAAVAGAYPDGTWFAELGELRQPEHIVTVVAGVFGVAEEPGRPLLDTVTDWVRHRRAILVLDNCEHMIDDCATLCQRLLASSAGLQVIATSREPLHIAAEAVWQVPPLAIPAPETADGLAGYDAIRLFAERAAAVAPGFRLGPGNLATVAAICRAVDGLPLAIELASAWVRVLSADQIAARLDRRLALLTSTSRGAPARQQTLRATLDWSFGLLSGSEQLLLCRLSALAAWSLDIAEQVCAGGPIATADVLDLLTALADKSLIEVEPEALGEVRYRMLQTVREYAADRLERSGEAAEMRRRWRDYIVGEVERLADVGMARSAAPWSATVAVFRRFDVETPNLREVLGDCLADGDAATGLRICTAARPVWLVRGSFADGVAWLDALLGLPAARTLPDAIRGPALVGRAQLALAGGSDAAAGLAQTALTICRAAGDPFWVGTALNLLAEVALHKARLSDAAGWADDALTTARQGADRWNEGYALGTMAAVAARQGGLDRAHRLAAEGLAVMRDIEQLWGAARTMLGLGDLAQLRGDPAGARELYLEALPILREVSARPEIARCLAGLGRLAIQEHDTGAARQHLTESLQLSYASGSRIGIARGLELIAVLSAQEGYPQVAVQLAGAVAALRAAAGFAPVPAARTQPILDAAAGLGMPAVHRLWRQGAGMTPADALRLAVADPALDGGHRHGRPANSPAASLTAREWQVADLLAAGLSNRQIAADLGISQATAARHVANILAKLGFSSRGQAGAWARQAADR